MNLVPFPAHDGEEPREGSVPRRAAASFARLLETKLAGAFPGERFSAYPDRDGANVILAAPSPASGVSAERFEFKVRTLVSRLVRSAPWDGEGGLAS